MYSTSQLAMDAVSKQIAAKAPTTTPDDQFAELTRQQYEDFKKNFSGLEDSLIARATSDTSLIDQAKKDTVKASGLTKGIADRNASRYGIGMSADLVKARDTNIQRQNTLGGVDAINNARVDQKELNTSLLASLTDIGNGVNSSAVSSLGSAAATAASRKNAYTQAQAASKANTYSIIGTLGAAAMLAPAI